VQRARVDLLVDAVALELLVVGVKVLHRGNHALALHAIHIRHAQPRAEVRVLAVALEIAPPERHAVDVHRRPQNHVPAQSLYLLPDSLTLPPDQLRVPCGGHGHARRKARGKYMLLRATNAGDGRAARPRAHAQRPVGHFDGRNPQPLNRRRLHPARAGEHGRLFFQSHAAQQVGHALFRRKAGVLIRRTGRNGCRFGALSRGSNLDDDGKKRGNGKQDYEERNHVSHWGYSWGRQTFCRASLAMVADARGGGQIQSAGSMAGAAPGASKPIGDQPRFMAVHKTSVREQIPGRSQNTGGRWQSAMRPFLESV